MRAEPPCNIDARLRLGESHDLRSPGPVIRQGLRLASGNIQPKHRCAGVPRFPSRPGEGLRGVAITYAPETTWATGPPSRWQDAPPRRASAQ
jgi:hypothetical protein